MAGYRGRPLKVEGVRVEGGKKFLLIFFLFVVVDGQVMARWIGLDEIYLGMPLKSPKKPKMPKKIGFFRFFRHFRIFASVS